MSSSSNISSIFLVSVIFFQPDEVIPGSITILLTNSSNKEVPSFGTLNVAVILILSSSKSVVSILIKLASVLLVL